MRTEEYIRLNPFVSQVGFFEASWPAATARPGYCLNPFVSQVGFFAGRFRLGRIYRAAGVSIPS